ncbi:kinesin-4-like protein [Raphidocelis subcapitata]|uniref:Kinesin-4-like protein n=1 Tax=Raphidocelis subcapitata TaxID=307507 RepID=A0A2V0NNG7_9CHLO|nr:kinesin-4-like protein [Raphidocelis subcapitata]|eukprot:GBF88032.1 kinesin-4-like protein [Raphidocelis subcapitata]
MIGRGRPPDLNTAPTQRALGGGTTALRQLAEAVTPAAAEQAAQESDLEMGLTGRAGGRAADVRSFQAAIDTLLPPGHGYSAEELVGASSSGGGGEADGERLVDCVLALRSAAEVQRACASTHGAASQQQERCPTHQQEQQAEGPEQHASPAPHHEPGNVSMLPPQAANGFPGPESLSCSPYISFPLPMAPGPDGTPPFAGPSTLYGASSGRRLSGGAAAAAAGPPRVEGYRHSLTGAERFMEMAAAMRMGSPAPSHMADAYSQTASQQQLALAQPQHGLVSSPSSGSLDMAPRHSGVYASPAMPGGTLSGSCSPTKASAMHHALSPLQLPPLPQPPMPSALGLPMGGPPARSAQSVAGVTRLMQQCSSMLRDRMYAGGGGAVGGVRGSYGSPAAFDPQEVLFPVVDSVLGQITQEYEKRLLAKDQELAAARERASAAQREASEAKERLARVESERAREGAAAARAASEAAVAETGARAGQAEALRAELEAAEAELRALRGEADEGARARAEREARLEEALEEARRELEAAAELSSKYRGVVEQNRELYNQVQDLKGAIRVFCRIRPLGATGDSSFSCVDVNEEGDAIALYNPARDDHKEFRVNRVFDQAASQDEVYDDTQPLVRSVLDGFNVCIFAYGQTGSGKTHTMSGTDAHQAAGRGINYRALDDLFSIRDARRGEVEYSITVQMLEIYNETLRDLLADGACAGARLDILSTRASGCNVPGAVQVEVDDASDVARIMAHGAANRATSETRMNDRSSRSHQILTVIVDGASRVNGSRSHGCLHLIDLAGSERVAKSEAAGDRLVEAQHINRSLSALGDVMTALASRSSHVPFRNSKLTQLLQDSLCGQAKVMMFMHISPEASSYGESVSTLSFAKRVAEVTLGQAKRNIESGKIFRANEALAAARAQAQRSEAELRAAQDAAEVHRRDALAAAAARDAAEREARELRAQLEAARREAAALSQRRAAVAAQAHEQAHQLAELNHQMHLQHTSQHAQQSQHAHGGQQHSPGGGRGAAAAAGVGAGQGGPAGGVVSPPSAGASKVPRLPLDRAPARDQDYSDSPRRASLPRGIGGAAPDGAAASDAGAGAGAPGSSGSAKAGAAGRHVATTPPPLRRGSGTDDVGGSGGAPRGSVSARYATPRGDRERSCSLTPPASARLAAERSGGSAAAAMAAAAMAGRGSTSAQRHADRLQAARRRASGVVGPAAAAAAAVVPAAAAAAGAGLRGELPPAAAAAALRSVRASLGATAPPLTARASGVVHGDLAAFAKAAASARQSGTWGSRPGFGAAAGAAGPGAGAGLPPATTRTSRARGAAGGGMWK